MNKKPKLVYGIKGKLVSAACMLLVAVIMVVSSTYAWFTLSTAPEVTGIQTAVGANGSLEMALLPSSGKAGDVTSNVGDSLAADTVKNLTWGNVVNLTNAAYGLDQITLYPSKLNTDGTTLKAAMLQTPKYGADGRVSLLGEDTVTGIYDAGEKGFPVSTGFGVRAVGVASGMTQRQLDYRNAISEANNYASKAKNAASVSLNTYGSALANIVVQRALSPDEAYDQDDVTTLKNLVASLQAADGPLANIEKAYMQYILGYAASFAVQDGVDKDKDETATAWKVVQGLVTANGATLDTVMSGLTTAGVTLPTEFSSAIDKLNATKDAVADAKDDLDALTGKSITWAQISVPVYKLANVDAMTVNNMTVEQIKDDMGAFANTVTNGINVQMTTGGGVYADIADHCGEYSASIVIKELNAGNGIAMRDVNARMHAKGTTPAYLTACGTKLTAAGAPLGTGTTMPISEFYGYVIDLAFRTNAVESSLLLQTTPVDRIYDDNNNAETMGHGSTMTFQAVSTDFDNDQVKKLMKSIRVVFFTPAVAEGENNTIVAYAKLDVDNATIGADGVTANLYLYTSTTTTTCTVTIDGNAQTVYKKAENEYYTTSTFDEGTKVADGIEVKEVTTTTEEMIKAQDDAKIIALQQNVATALSALVYLDGETIGNDDVAATAAKSLTGTMNLQFSSSATLVPMEYANLHQSGTATGAKSVKAGETVTLDAVDGATYAFDGTATDWTITDTNKVTAPSTAAVGDIVKVNVTKDGKVVKIWTITVTE